MAFISFWDLLENLYKFYIPYPASCDFSKSKDVVLAFISWSTSACFCFLFLMGCYSSIPISDVSAQGPKLVLTTAVAHWVLERSCPEAHSSKINSVHLGLRRVTEDTFGS